jgi:leader peptidase (prepilin peptidase)/N-methyltransferase
MNDEIDITELASVKECFSRPLFYILLAILIPWGLFYSPWEWLFTVPFAVGLALLTTIDIKHMILPHIITIPMTILALVLHPLMGGHIFMPALGAIIGFILFFLIFYISYKAKGTPSMGFGDVILLTMLGAWLGIAGLPLVLIYASTFALTFVLLKTIYKKGFNNTPFPYGPFLCLGGWLTFLYHEETWAVILNFRETILTMIG